MFAFNPITLEVSDTERGLVLKRLSASSDGTVYFEISGNGKILNFRAHMLSGELAKDRHVQLALSEEKILIVWIVLGWDRQSQSLIREAMLAMENGAISKGMVSGINEDVRRDWSRAVATIEFAGDNKL